MILEKSENIKSDISGTIIDVEFIGQFNRFYSANDSRRYKDIKQVIFGYIDRESLHIYCAKGMEAISELDKQTPEIVNSLKRPFYAFHSRVESAVLSRIFGHEFSFNGELSTEWKENKATAVRELNISNYDDPFFNDGTLCTQAWKDSKFDEAIAHNRACLLKERDILIKRNFRKPDD